MSQAFSNGNGKSLQLNGRRLEGKVAIITGGAMGIGEATAKIFALHGAKVMIIDILDDLGQSVCAAININNKDSESEEEVATFIHCDVTKEADIKNAVDFTVTKYGKLDIMFNNAGIVEPAYSRITDFDVSEFERSISVNCTGVFLGIKHAARVMMAAGIKGSIINNGSACTIVGGLVPHGYAAGKHAVVGLTKNTAAELGQHGIRVNCISAWMSTSSLVTERVGKDGKKLEDWLCGMANLKGGAVLRSEDTALAAVYFGSDESKYVSGHNFVIDGGFTTVNHSFGLFKQDH